MATDNTIALQIKPPPPPESPLKSFGDLMQIRDIASQVQLRQAQMRHADQQAQVQQAEAQQKQRDLDDQNTVQAHFETNPDAMKGFFASGGDLTKGGAFLPKGIQPKTAQAMATNAGKLAQEYQATRSSKAKNDAEAMGEIQKSVQSIYDRGLEDPTTIAPNWSSMLQNNPFLKDLPFPIPKEVPTNLNQLKDYSASIAGYHGMAEAAIARQKELSGIAETQAKTGQAVATTGKTNLESQQLQRQQIASQLSSIAESNPGALAAAIDAVPDEHKAAFQGMTDPAKIRRVVMTPEQVVQSDRETADLERRRQSDAETKRYHNAEIGARGAEVGVQRERLKLEQTKAGFDMNGGISDTARAIADGTYDAETVKKVLGKNPGLISQVKALDPDFDQANVDKRSQTLKEFTKSGTTSAGGQAIALNTLIHHADLYLQASEALHNGSFKPGNAAYNSLATMFGSAPPQNADLIAQFLAGEGGKVATGGVPAEGEIKAMLSKLGSSNSPEGSRGAAQTIISLAAGKLAPLQEKVRDAKLEKVVHVLGDDAKEVLTRRGFDPNTMKPRGMIQARDPQGKLHQAPAGTALPPGWTEEKGR